MQRMTAVAAALSLAIARRPVLFLIGSLVLVAACFAGARLLQPDFTYRAFFAVDDPLRVQVETFEERFSNDDSVVVILHSPSGILDAASAATVLSMTEGMWRVPDIVRVESLSNYNWVRGEDDEVIVEPMIPDAGLDDPIVRRERSAAIAAEPLIRDYLLSADGRTTMIVGFVRDAGDQSAEAAPIIAAVQELVAAHEGSDHVFHITGRMAVMAGLQESAQADAQTTLPIVFLSIILLLALTQRRLWSVLLPALLIVLSVVATMGLSGWMGMRISSVTAMVPQFILAIAVADAVHVLSAYARLRRAGLSRRPAVEEALRDNFVPTLLTSVTTAIGFLTFTATNIVAIGELGVMVGVGVILAWILTYSFLGAGLALLPDLRRGRPQAADDHDTDALKEESLEPWSWMPAYVAIIRRWRAPIVLGTVALAIGAAALSTTNAINANPFKYFDESFWLRQSSDFAEANLAGSQGIELVVHAAGADGIKEPAFLQRVEAFQAWIDTVPGVVKTVSVIDFIKQTNEAFNGDDPAFYRLPDTREGIAEMLFLYTFNLPQGLDLSNRVPLENDAVRISVRWTLYDSRAATAMADTLEARAAELGLAVETTGKMLLMQRMNGYVSQALLVSLGIAIVLIGILLMVVFRSPQLGGISIVTNALPLGFGVAALTLVGNDIDTGTVVALAVCLGIAVDDTIHLLQAIRTNRHLALDDAIARGVRKVLPAITLTTLILLIGFGGFMAGDFVPNQNFGLLAVVILSTALVIDLTFLPAMLMLLDRGREARLPQTETAAARSA